MPTLDLNRILAKQLAHRIAQMEESLPILTAAGMTADADKVRGRLQAARAKFAEVLENLDYAELQAAKQHA